MNRNRLEGQVVDVAAGEVFPGRIEFSDGLITDIRKADAAPETYLIPGLIDSHAHIESSYLCPSRFAETVIPHGTTAVVADPHEIANVFGIEGVKFMIRDSKKAPLRCFFTAPSCVPAIPFETSGASLSHVEVEEMLSWPDVVALGEVMNFPAAIAGEDDLLRKIEAAKETGKPIDGHAPLLSGEGLKKYVSLGITTDHECTSAAEADEKHEAGMVIQVRQGTASKNLQALAQFAKNHRFMLVSDDRDAHDLLRGHMNAILQEAVSIGISPMNALSAATILPAQHYRLPGGWFEEGRAADIAVVEDLHSFRVVETWIAGRLVGRSSYLSLPVEPEPAKGFLPKIRKKPQDFALKSEGRSAKVRVIVALKDQIVTEKKEAELLVQEGEIVPDVDQDLLRIAVVNRYRDAPVANSFVNGFGLRKGAIASTVAHDSHNCIVVGVEKDHMADAANICLERGGLSVVGGGRVSVLELPIGGLMTYRSAHEAARFTDFLLDHARQLNCDLVDPFMTLSFMSLLVIPRLKLGDRGLFDVEGFSFVDPIMRR